MPFKEFCRDNGISRCSFQIHRSDSNQGSDYIANFLSLISGFSGQHLKIVENSYFYATDNLDFDHIIQEIILFKTLPFLSSSYIEFCYL